MEINRRTFIKLIGLASLETLTLSGCKKPVRKSKSAYELMDYDVIKYNDGEEKLAYIVYDGYGRYYELKFDDEYIREDEIYAVATDENYKEDKDILENMTDSLNVTYMNQALVSLEENIGYKEEYTKKELQDNLDIIKESLKSKNKILTK